MSLPEMAIMFVFAETFQGQQQQEQRQRQAVTKPLEIYSQVETKNKGVMKTSVLTESMEAAAQSSADGPRPPAIAAAQTGTLTTTSNAASAPNLLTAMTPASVTRCISQPEITHSSDLVLEAAKEAKSWMSQGALKGSVSPEARQWSLQRHSPKSKDKFGTDQETSVSHNPNWPISIVKPNIRRSNSFPWASSKGQLKATIEADDPGRRRFKPRTLSLPQRSDQDEPEAAIEQR